MKILHLLQSDRFSGAENVVCQIIGMLRDMPDIEMVYCSTDGQIREALAERGIRFVPLERFTVENVRAAIRAEAPDMIHAHDMRASFYAARACGKIPLVSHIHNNNFDSRGISPKSVAYMFAAAKAKHIFWVSQSSFDGYAFHRLLAGKSTVLYNIIDIVKTEAKMRADAEVYPYDVAYVGRLTHQKNPERLVRVLRLVHERLPQANFAVVGTGDLAEATAAAARECGLDGCVRFFGFMANPLKLLADSKVMVMTSLWEGTPMCALEALALGVPIVSTPTDGLRDLITTGENGILADTDEGLADGIATLLTDTERQARMSAAARAFSVRYNDMQKYRAALLAVYKDKN